MEEQVYFASGDIELEGLIHHADSNRGVVITHPHPLYGGDMHSAVVETIASAYQQKGANTLRFNFRGTGRSKGSHDDGRGEQFDVRAALAYLSDERMETIDLAGYSFGAWVNAHAVSEKSPVRDMVMVSPPVGSRAFEVGDEIACLKLVITGSRDDIAPAGVIERLLPQWNAKARLEIIDGADHFYAGYTGMIESILLSNI
jgi:hypothetical protein